MPKKTSRTGKLLIACKKYRGPENSYSDQVFQVLDASYTCVSSFNARTRLETIKLLFRDS